ncbi:ABC transporter ATP-binding protein [Desulfoplanes sp.]
MNSPLYELRSIGKTYQGPGEALQILSGIDLTIRAGESLAILGASGSGKSTLLHLLGTLDAPSCGELLFEGRPLADLDEQARAGIRNTKIGFVFQFHHLLPEFNTLENVAMPGRIAGQSRGDAQQSAKRALELVGLADRMEHKVTTLSGGERQRTSIARALLMEPQVILADEPTGNLDEKTAGSVVSLLLDLNQRLGTTLVVVTHNTGLAQRLDRQLVLRSGELYEQ